MPDSTVLLDPTDEREPIPRPLAVRPGRLTGPIGVVDISKARGDIFCDEVASLLAGRLPEIEVLRLRKPTYTKPAPGAMREEVAARCAAVIQALAD